MPKLQPKPIRIYELGDTMLNVKIIPGKQMISYFKIYNDVKDDQERIFDLYLDVITAYTDIENTKEEIAELLTYQEVLELGNFVFNFDTDYREENLD